MIPEKVMICGIPHNVELCSDDFDMDIHLGQIDYVRANIKINKNATPEMQEQSLIHEMLHGMFVMIGRGDLSTDETLVQSLASAIYQSFLLKAQQESEVEA